jgi:hypothetical protein
MSRFFSFLWIGLVVVGSPGSASADLINGGFETGNFTGWTTTGNTAVVGELGTGPTAIPVAAGSFQALLSTQGSATTASGLESFLGLPAGRLAALSGSPLGVFNGSAIRQTVSVTNAGDVLTFQWNFLTSETNPLANDFSFVSVVGSGVNQSFVLGSVQNSALSPTSAAPFTRQGGFRSFSFQFPSAGAYTVGVGVANVLDNNRPSGLVVDQFTVVVPEPATLAVFGAGTIAAVAWGRRRRVASR